MAFADHFTDEATFHIPENIHRHHVMMWRQDNLYFVTEHQNISPKMNFWFELTYSCMILHSFVGHTGKSYGTPSWRWWDCLQLDGTALCYMRLWTINKTGISSSWTLHHGLISEPDWFYKVTIGIFDVLHLVSRETKFHCDIFCPDFTPFVAYVWELRN